MSTCSGIYATRLLVTYPVTSLFIQSILFLVFALILLYICTTYFFPIKIEPFLSVLFLTPMLPPFGGKWQAGNILIKDKSYLLRLEQILPYKVRTIPTFLWTKHYLFWTDQILPYKVRETPNLKGKTISYL